LAPKDTDEVSSSIAEVVIVGTKVIYEASSIVMSHVSYRSSLILIITTALSALSLTVAGGLVVIRTTRESNSAAGWV
jgi:hypothetical protein